MRTWIVEPHGLRVAYSLLGGVPALVLGGWASWLMIRSLWDGAVLYGEGSPIPGASSAAFVFVWSLAGAAGAGAGWTVMWGRVPASRLQWGLRVGLVLGGLLATLPFVLMPGLVAIPAWMTLLVGLCVLGHLWKARIVS